MLDFHCKIPGCILDVIEFECPFNRKYSGVYFNETSSKKEDQHKPKDTNNGNGLCLGNKISFCDL